MTIVCASGTLDAKADGLPEHTSSDVGLGR